MRVPRKNSKSQAAQREPSSSGSDLFLLTYITPKCACFRLRTTGKAHACCDAHYSYKPERHPPPSGHQRLSAAVAVVRGYYGICGCICSCAEVACVKHKSPKQLRAIVTAVHLSAPRTWFAFDAGLFAGTAAQLPVALQQAQHVIDETPNNQEAGQLMSVFEMKYGHANTCISPVETVFIVRDKSTWSSSHGSVE